MIYGRSGEVATIKRMAVLADVRKLDKRLPDKHDRAAIRNGSFVVVECCGREILYHQAFLRADGGAAEIADAIAAVKGVKS